MARELTGYFALNDYIGNNNISLRGGPLTISAWVFGNGNAGVEIEIGGNGGIPFGAGFNSFYFDMVVVSGSQIELQSAFVNPGNSGAAGNVVAGPIPQSNAWYLCACTISQNSFGLYLGYPVSGYYALAGSGVPFIVPPFTIQSPVSFGIGSYGITGNGDSSSFGIVSDLNVWTTALSSGDLSNLANGVPAYNIHPSSLIMSYAMVGPSSLYEPSIINGGPLLASPSGAKPSILPIYPPVTRGFGPKVILRDPYFTTYNNPCYLFCLGCLPYSSGGAFNDHQFSTDFNNICGCGNPPAWTTTLFMHGSGQATNNIPLFTWGSGQATNNISLFTWGSGQATNNIPLFVECQFSSGNIPLFTWGSGQFTSNTTLFTWCGLQQSGSTPLFTWGYSSVNNLQGSFNYDFTQNEFGGGNPLPLFIWGSGQSTNNIPLFTWGSGQSTNNIPLFLPCQFSSGNIPLYIANSFGASGMMNLFVYNNQVLTLASGHTNLFLDGYPGFSGFNGNIPLFVWGSGQTANGCNLFTTSYLTNSGSMDLYLYGYPTGFGSGNCPVYMWGNASASGTINLFLPSANGEGLNLYLCNNAQMQSGNSYTTLYIYGGSSGSCTGIYNSAPLFTWGQTTQNAITTLYTTNFGSSSGALDMYLLGYPVGATNSNVNLYLDGPSTPSLTNNTTLYVYNQQGGINNNTTLFVENNVQNNTNSLSLFVDASVYPVSGAMNMYIYRPGGKDAFANSVSLYTAGSGIGYLNGATSLFVSGDFSAYNNTTLYTIGIGQQTSDLPLYMQVNQMNVGSGGVSLFTWGQSLSGLYDTTTLFMPDPIQQGSTAGSLYLYLREALGEDFTSALNLYLKTVGNPDGSMPDNNNMTLFMCNNYIAQSSTLELFMNAPSGTQGLVPFSGSMDLVMGRLNSMANSVPFYVAGPIPMSGGMPLFTYCQPSMSGNVPLYMSALGINTSTTKLYTIGF